MRTGDETVFCLNGLKLKILNQSANFFYQLFDKV